MRRHTGKKLLGTQVVVDSELPPHEFTFLPGNYRVGDLVAFEEKDPTYTDYDEAEKTALERSQESFERDTYPRAYAVWDMDRGADCVAIAYMGWVYLP